MNWFVGVASYVVIWWIVIFAILPFGLERVAEHQPGHDAGAPANPRLKLKALVTTLVAGVLWTILYFAVARGVMDFRGPA